MGSKNGWGKNLQVLSEEWERVSADHDRNMQRWKSRNWDKNDREHFTPHVLAAIISTLLGLRRHMLYIVIIWAAGFALGMPWLILGAILL